MNRQEFETHFKEHYALVYRVAFLWLKRHADAEDVVQEVFLRMLKSAPDFVSEEHKKAWIIRTAINLCKDMSKSKWNNVIVSLDKLPEEEKAYFHLPYMKEDDTLWAVMELPDRYRDCLYFFYYEDYSIKEIAHILDMPENTVKTNLKRGREALKQILQKD